MSAMDAQNDRLNTLWFDLKASVQVAETPAVFDKHCRVTRHNGIDPRQVELCNPDLIVFEFDYPSREDMEQAAGFKIRHSNIPMIVITVQHSEALAVWFFRKKFIDFLVQPVTASEATHCLNEVKRITQLRRGQEKRKPASLQSALPPEVSHSQGATNPLLPAIALIESAYFDQLTVTQAEDAALSLRALLQGRVRYRFQRVRGALSDPRGLQAVPQSERAGFGGRLRGGFLGALVLHQDVQASRWRASFGGRWASGSGVLRNKGITRKLHVFVLKLITPVH